MPFIARPKGRKYAATGRRDARFDHRNLQRAESVRRTFGCVTHLAPLGSSFTPQMEATAAAELGLGWVRLGIHDTGFSPAEPSTQTGPYLADYITRLVGAGLEYSLITRANVAGSRDVLAAALALITDPAVIAKCIGIEGVNEPDLQGINQAACQTQHNALVAIHAANPAWAAVPIIPPSMSGPGANGSYSPITGTHALRHVHGYRRPGGALDRADWLPVFDSGASPFGAITDPCWVSEFGWSNGSDPTLDSPNIETVDTVVGSLALRVFFGSRVQTANLIERIAYYCLHDHPSVSGWDKWFGMMLASGVAKPSYLEVQRALTWLRDSAANATTFPLRPFSTTITSSATVLPLITQRSDGRSRVHFWRYSSELTTNATGGGSPWPAGTVSLPSELAGTFTFDHTFREIHLVDLRAGTTTLLAENAATVTTNVAGTMRALELVW